MKVAEKPVPTFYLERAEPQFEAGLDLMLIHVPEELKPLTSDKRLEEKTDVNGWDCKLYDQANKICESEWAQYTLRDNSPGSDNSFDVEMDFILA